MDTAKTNEKMLPGNVTREELERLTKKHGELIPLDIDDQDNPGKVLTAYIQKEIPDEVLDIYLQTSDRKQVTANRVLVNTVFKAGDKVIQEDRKYHASVARYITKTIAGPEARLGKL